MTTFKLIDNNLVINPGFENGMTSPSNWVLVTQNGNAPVWDSGSHTGSRSIKIYIPGSIDVKSGFPKSDLIQVKASSDYIFSVWGKTLNAGGTSRPAVRVVQLDANKNSLLITNVLFSQGTNDWTQKQIDFKTLSNTAYIYIYANIWGGYGTFWMDDVALSLKGASPAPTPAPIPQTTPAPAPTPAPKPTLLFDGSFHADDKRNGALGSNMAGFGKYNWWYCIPQEDSITILPANIVPGNRSGYLARFILRPGTLSDCGGNQHVLVSARIPGVPSTSTLKEIWVGWSTMLDPSWQPQGSSTGWEHFAFLAESTDMAGFTPNAGIYTDIDPSSTAIHVLNNVRHTEGRNVLSAALHTKNEWHDWLYHVNFKADNTGFIELFHRTRNQAYALIYSKYNTPTQPAGDVGDEYQWRNGIYRCSTSTSTQILYSQGIKIGTTRADVEYGATPTPVPTPTPTPTPFPQATLTARLTYSPSSPNVGDMLTLDASASSPGTGATITKYDWFSNNIMVATGRIASMRVTDYVFILGLRITDSTGQTATASKSIFITPPGTITPTPVPVTPTPVPTPSPTPIPQSVVDMCSWAVGLGGWKAIKAYDIMSLVSAYSGISNVGFMVTSANIMGAVAYYSGNVSNGNSLTGCAFT